VQKPVQPTEPMRWPRLTARHGHKTDARSFDGYEGHLALDPDSELVTATAVTPGDAGDAAVAPELLAEDLAEREEAPLTIYGDSAMPAASCWPRSNEPTPSCASRPSRRAAAAVASRPTTSPSTTPRPRPPARPAARPRCVGGGPSWWPSSGRPAAPALWWPADGPRWAPTFSLLAAAVNLARLAVLGLFRDGPRWAVSTV
jgi:hypothetical protein